MYKILVLGVLGMCSGVLSHTYHLGACPVVGHVPGLEMDKMLGVWYVIQKTSTTSHCIRYNFTRIKLGKYRLEQISQHFLMGLTSLNREHKYTEILAFMDWSIEAKLMVEFPESLAGPKIYTVIATEYSKYAVIFTCEKLEFAHRRSAAILSRSKDLNNTYIDEMRAKLLSFGVDTHDLTVISQHECPRA